MQMRSLGAAYPRPPHFWGGGPAARRPRSSFAGPVPVHRPGDTLRRMALRTVLITGCSTGTGGATALRLVRGGGDVSATGRQPATRDELAAAGCHVLALDVTSEESMNAALTAIGG